MSTTCVPTPNALGSEVYGSVSQAFDAQTDRRARARFPWRSALTIWVTDEANQFDESREIEVTTTDISQTGIGFEYRQYIHPGSTVRTRFDALEGAPVVDGVVAHCHLDGQSVHRIGVQFLTTTSHSVVP